MSFATLSLGSMSLDSGDITPGVAAPTAPVLSVESVVGTTVTLSFVVDETIGEGDNRQVQIQEDGGDWSSTIVDSTAALTSGEAAAGELEIDIPTPDAGTYDVRMRVREGSDGPWSGWSNVDEYVVEETWTPLDDANLRFWYSAHEDDAALYSDAGTTPATNGQGVQQANDLGPNDYHLKQATSGKRPDVLDSGINGHRVMDFTAANDDFLGTDTGSVVLGANGTAPFSAALVCAMHSETESNARIATFTQPYSNDTSSNGVVIAMRDESGNAISAWRGTEESTQAISLGTPVIFIVVFDGTDCKTYINNANEVSSANTATFGSAGRFALGCAMVNNQAEGAGTHFDGLIGECFGADQAWDSTERTQVFDYLSAKWGIT